ncbi:hypothetical protein ACLB2K_020689 [Fragaria x ananassa]
MEVQKEKVGVVVRRNKIEKKAKVTAKKSNKNKKKDAAEEVQEDVTDHFMEIATEQVQEGVIVLFQEGATEQVQEETKYLTLEDWEELKDVDEFEDAIYEQNAAETKRILRKFFSQDRDGETEVFSKKMKHKKMSTPEELEQWVKQMEKEALIYNIIRYQSSEDEDVNNVEQKRRRYRHDGSAIDTCASCKRNSNYIERLCEEKEEVTKKYKKLKAKMKKKEEHNKKSKIKCRQLWLLRKGLEGAGSEKDIEDEKECATSQEAEKGEAAKDDKVAETVTAKATEKGKVEIEAQPATSPRTRSIVKRIKERRDRKEKKLEDYEVQGLSKKPRNGK